MKSPEEIAFKLMRCLIISSEKSIQLGNTMRATWVFEQIYTIVNTFHLRFTDNEVWRILKLAIALIDGSHWVIIQQTIETVQKTKRSTWKSFHRMQWNYI